MAPSLRSRSTVMTWDLSWSGWALPLGGRAGGRNRSGATALAEEAQGRCQPGFGLAGFVSLGFRFKRQGAADRCKLVEQVVGFLDQALSFGIELALRAVAANESSLGLDGGDIGETAVNLAEPIIDPGLTDRVGLGVGLSH